jgi:hypothetical protein
MLQDGEKDAQALDAKSHRRNISRGDNRVNETFISFEPCLVLKGMVLRSGALSPVRWDDAIGLKDGSPQGRVECGIHACVGRSLVARSEGCCLE